MNHEQFLTTAAEFGGLERSDAERAIRATLQTLAERIAEGEARDLAAELPPEDAAWLATKTPAEPFDLREFLRRVGERAGVDPAAAERYATAVFAALGRAVSGDEFDNMVAELPRDYERLLPRGRPVEVPELDAFLGKVAERAGLDRQAARRASEAVLETLAERIAGGEVDDLVERLPAELEAPLRRGRDSTGGEPRKMSFDEFLERIADREGVGLDDALAHARAVLTTLHEEIPDSEFHDLTAQLPHDYDRVLAHR